MLLGCVCIVHSAFDVWYSYLEYILTPSASHTLDKQKRTSKQKTPLMKPITYFFEMAENKN